mmetsp:Transcript_10752/g.26912  ORF Transcript_10752/g.26912 Transcript_10752/m.26912 type:complete len:428 (+) Transcript_10752:74-1357(+)
MEERGPVPASSSSSSAATATANEASPLVHSEGDEWDEASAGDVGSRPIPALPFLWTAVFVCGVFLSAAFFSTGDESAGAAGDAARSSQRRPVVEAKYLVSNFEEQQKQAFVMMAAEVPGQLGSSSLWGCLSVARALQRLSERHLVLLTDFTTFPDKSSVQKNFEMLGVDVRVLQKVIVPGLADTDVKSMMLQKLQAWRLTEFEKVIWVDWDVLVFRNVDWLFDREWMWAARDDPLCHMQAESPNTGILMLYPDEVVFNALVDHASKVPWTNANGLIRTYFADVQKRPVKLLSEVEADYGQCLGHRIPTPYRNKDGTTVTGAWSTPAFVHKSGGVQYTWYEGQKVNEDENTCFSIDLKVQRLPSKGQILNVCHYHPLSAYWRDNLCSAASDLLKIKTIEVESFCSDECYYQLSGDFSCLEQLPDGPMP